MKKRLWWLSDIHADILGLSPREQYARLKGQHSWDILVTGDITNAPLLAQDLGMLATSFADRSVYFTLGNHDHYGDSLEGVQHLVEAICARHRNLIYLDRHGPVWLSNKTVLIGCPGWGDGRAGAGSKSTLTINDRTYVSNFLPLTRDEYFENLRSLGRASAAAFLRTVWPVLGKAGQLIVATHVPPFAGCLVRGKCYLSYAPFYVNMALGRVILRVARQHPSTKFSVYSGHTHRATIYSPLRNVSVHVAGAHYGFFEPAGTIQVN